MKKQFILIATLAIASINAVTIEISQGGNVDTFTTNTPIVKAIDNNSTFYSVSGTLRKGRPTPDKIYKLSARSDGKIFTFRIARSMEASNPYIGFGTPEAKAVYTQIETAYNQQ